ncbi:hypothetical protein [Pseudonocardia sp. H11422]|uniref:hypothetical protein n=1 Tax=Pseudonocardia sp. H11422 TaxID=2835866 RepID=UPI001BDCFBB2|nr:hypothetical protein [Pseudonocardia sp. H11422]
MQRLSPPPLVRHALLSHRLTVVAAALVYVAVLHYIHQNHIAPTFSYLQYTYRYPDPLSYAFAIALVVVSATVLPRRISRPSHFIVWTLFTVAVVPSIVVPQYTEVLPVTRAAELAMWVTGSYLLVAVFGTRRALRGFLPRLQMTASTFWIGIAVLAAAGYAYILATVGLRLELPSLSDVYGVRAEFAGEEASSALLSYLVPLLANVLNPIIMLRGLYAKRWPWIVVGIVGQMFIFSFTGYRTAILSPLALIAASVLFRRRARPSGAALLVAMTAVSAATVVMDWVTSSIEWTSLLVRRFLITPGLLTAGYVAVFSDIEKAHLAHSFLSPLFHYPHEVEPPLLVGAQFFGNEGTNANANLLADGFANFGYPGMVIACLALVVLLWVIDDAARGIPLAVSSLVFLMPTLALADSGVFTAMLTHGFLAAVLVCLCMPRLGWGRRPARSRPSAAPGRREAQGGGGRC